MAERVNVYIADIEYYMDETHFTEGLAHISRERRAAIGRLRAQKDKVRSLCCGLLLHYGLYDLGYTDNESWTIAYGEKGKPYFTDHPDVCFNLSHSGDYVACAIADRPVGIDIQNERKTIPGMERTVCPEDDLNTLYQTDEERHLHILESFSAKEAYLKYTGMGMSIGFPNVLVDRKEGTACLSDGSGAAFLQRIALPEQPNYRIFVCYSKLFTVYTNIPHNNLIHEKFSSNE